MSDAIETSDVSRVIAVANARQTAMWDFEQIIKEINKDE